LPIPPEILVTDPKVIAATITDVPRKKRIRTIEPAFCKPTQSPVTALLTEQKKKRPAEKQITKTSHHKNVSHSATPPTPKTPIIVEDTIIENIEKRLQETDKQLNHLIETWPRLSIELKETISALLKNSG
jgi:hypothetical protein